jgi:heme-degrading monooxygenase HmoA
MFSHIIELTAKPGQALGLVAAIRDRAIPEVIMPAEGFVDQIVLMSDSDPDHVTSISFWRSKEYADRFFQTGFREVSILTAPFLDAEPESHEFSVEVSTNDDIRPSAVDYEQPGSYD